MGAAAPGAGLYGTARLWHDPGRERGWGGTRDRWIMVLDAKRSVLIVVDMQERLAPAMHGLEPVLRNAGILMQAAARLAVPVVVTEQYPQGLGRTVEPVAGLAPPGSVVEKVEFSAALNDAFNRRLAELDRPVAVVCGIEAHVCVLQTALDLAGRGVTTAVVRDACTSRVPLSAETAYARAARHGIEIVTTEMVVFEWLRRADSPLFRELSRMIK